MFFSDDYDFYDPIARIQAKKLHRNFLKQKRFRGLKTLKKQEKKKVLNEKMLSREKSEQNACRKRIVLAITTTIFFNCGYAIFLSAALAATQELKRYRPVSAPPLQSVSLMVSRSPMYNEETAQWLSKRNLMCYGKKHHRNDHAQQIMADQRKSFAQTSLRTDKSIETFDYLDYNVDHHPEVVKANETSWKVTPEDVGPTLCYPMSGKDIRDIINNRPAAKLEDLIKLDSADSAVVKKLAIEAEKLKPGLDDVIYIRLGFEGLNQANDVFHEQTYRLQATRTCDHFSPDRLYEFSIDLCPRLNQKNDLGYTKWRAMMIDTQTTTKSVNRDLFSDPKRQAEVRTCKTLPAEFSGHSYYLLGGLQGGFYGGICGGNGHANRPRTYVTNACRPTDDISVDSNNTYQREAKLNHQGAAMADKTQFDREAITGSYAIILVPAEPLPEKAVHKKDVEEFIIKEIGKTCDVVPNYNLAPAELRDVKIHPYIKNAKPKYGPTPGDLDATLEKVHKAKPLTDTEHEALKTFKGKMPNI
jgi:hypothetical protein